jgi:hypothetical protein
VGTYTEYLESGRPLAAGDTTDTADQRLIDAGVLVPVTESEPSDTSVTTPVTTTTDPKETGADAAGN